MAKPVCVSAAMFIAFSSVLGAWGQAPSMVPNQTPPDIHFPLNSDQAWALEESLLVWKAFEDDTDYAVRSSFEGLQGPSTKEQLRIKHPSFDWATGVRLKLTRYLPSSDPWDIDLIGTYYYSDGENHVKVNPADLSPGFTTQKAISSPWETNLFGTISKAQANVQLNFFNFDLIVGRYYSLTQKIDIHPFVGMRSVLLYQKYHAKYRSTTDINTHPITLTRTDFKGNHNFWGVGPRIGVDLSMHVGRHWSFLSTLGASLFAGRYWIKEEFEGIISTAPNHQEDKIKDGFAVLRSNLDASLGLGWEKWVRNGTVRIAPSFMFEVSEWFAMKRWISMYNSEFLGNNNIPIPKTHRRYSDLGLMGFNVNLQVDF